MAIFKKVMITLGIILGVLILIVLGYVAYVWFQYYRIEDKKDLEIENQRTDVVEVDKEYTLTTYNIGFGAYNQEYSFFLDKGYMADGTPVVGKYSKAVSYEAADTNTNGSINAIKEINPDFMFFQEVDDHATRSYYINQYERIKDTFKNHLSIFANNFHSAYILYPFNDFMGKASAGIVTLSRYKMDSSIRYQLPLSDSKFDNLFDLDRCFSITRTKVSENKDLVLINIHMSAYDEGGKVRAEQFKLLNQVLKQEKDNYVIVGGDYNHILTKPETPFKTGQLVPDWIATINPDELYEGYHIVTGTNAPTCRSCDIPYEKGVNFTGILDGFICNDNIEVVNVEVVDLDFKYSDRNPVKLTFKLKK